MSGSQAQAKETQAEKQRKPVPPALTPATENALPELPFDPIMLFSGGTLESQVSLLQRLPQANQQAAIQHIQRTQGGHHVQRLVAALQPASEPAPTHTPAQRAPQSATGGSGIALAAATPAATAAPPAPAPARHTPVIQPKLSVSEPDDPFEVEAERTADMVMKMPAPATPPPPPDDKDKNKGVVQRAAEDTGGGGIDPQVESRVHSLKGRGQPMPDDLRSFYEERMDADFSKVRLHTDDTAVQTSQDLSARAYTVGADIAFNRGEYQPGTQAGKHLLAHELTHVVQQGGAAALKRESQVQRAEGDGVAPEAPEPTPEEKAAAEAAAALAEALAAQARSEGEARTAQSRAQEASAQVEGEPPRQVSAESLAQGPVQQTEEEARRAEVAAQAQASAAAHVAAQTAAMQGAQAAVTQSTQAAMQQAAQNAQTQAAAAASVQAATEISAKIAAQAAQAQAQGAGSSGAAAATTAAQAAVEQAFATAANPPDKAPVSAQEDPDYQQVQSAAEAAGVEQQTHEEAQGKADAAQEAVESPSEEIKGQAQAEQVNEMESAETPDFDAAAFKARLMERIAALAPSTPDAADNFKENGVLNGVKGDMQGEVASQRETSETPLEEATAAEPDTGSVEPKPFTPLQPEDPGAVPGDIGATAAAPKARGQGEFETPVQDSSKALDQQMADAEITEEQLQNSNEPAFTSALEAKGQAQTEAAESPSAYRQFEQGQLSSAEADAVAAAQAGLQDMHATRAEQFAQVEMQQEQAKSEDEQARLKVAQDIQGIYAETKSEVEGILSGLDAEVNRIFDAGAAEAKTAFENFVDAKMDAYKEKRYGGWLGWAQWIADKFTGLPSEVNVFYTEGRQLYLDKMDAVIDNVVAVIGATLAEAKAAVAKGKQRIQDYVAQLPEDLRAVGQEAATAIESQFDQLEQDVDAKQGELIETLAQKYQENLEAVDARIEEMKAANRGLIDLALDAIGGVIKTILELKDMLLSVLQRAADAVMMILADPIGFIGNLIKAVGLGLKNFALNIGKHLQAGFITWLTGNLTEAGITLPENWDLKGIFGLVMQILGLTWENFRARAVGVFGERVVSALETGFEIFMILREQGLPGLWEWVKDKLNTLKEQVFEGIKEMLISEVIEAGIQWLVGILGGPAGAFVKAVKMIYDIVMWFINNASRIMALVNSIIDSITAIAAGSLDAAAAYVEESLAKFVPVVIGFLAGLLGLGDLGAKVRKIIDKIQKPINSAIDSVLNMIKGFVQKVAKMLGFGGDSKEDGQIGKEIPFTAAEESHKLWVDVQGGSATLMIASDPMPVEARLADWQGRMDSLSDENKAKAGGLLAQARSKLSGADASADFLAQKKQEVKKVDDGDKIQQEQGKLEGEQTSLADVLKQLFEIFGDEMPDEMPDDGALALYRGIHFKTTWNEEDYDRQLRSSLVGEPTFSAAAREIAGCKTPDGSDVDKATLENAAAQVQEAVKSSQDPNSVKQWWNTKKQVFDSVFYALLQRYVNTYKEFNQELEKRKGVYSGFKFTKIPFISTSKKASHAAKYAVGDTGVDATEKRNTGIVGRLFIYVFGLKELADLGALNIKELHEQKKINVKHRFLDQGEVTFTGSIPGENLVGQEDANAGEAAQSLASKGESVAQGAAQAKGGLREW